MFVMSVPFFGEPIRGPLGSRLLASFTCQPRPGRYAAGYAWFTRLEAADPTYWNAGSHKTHRHGIAVERSIYSG